MFHYYAWWDDGSNCPCIIYKCLLHFICIYRQLLWVWWWGGEESSLKMTTWMALEEICCWWIIGWLSRNKLHIPQQLTRGNQRKYERCWLFWLLLQQLKAQQVCLWLSVPFSFFFCRCRRRLRHHHPFIFTKNPYKRHNNKKNIVFRIKLVNEMFRCCCILICIFLMLHLLLCIG